MNYLLLINNFWSVRHIRSMTAHEADFYFYLLKECNTRKWLNPFELPSRNIELELGISRKTICELRSKLQQKGLIRYKEGDRRKAGAFYEIINVSENNPNSNEKGNQKGNIHSNQNGNPVYNKQKQKGMFTLPAPTREEENSSLLKLKNSLSWNSIDWEFVRRIEGIESEYSPVWRFIENVYTNPGYTVENVVSALRSLVRTGSMYVKDTTKDDLRAELSSLGIHSAGIDEILHIAAGNYKILWGLILQVKQSKGKIVMPQAFILSRLRT